jgi:hypothetical protein
VYKLKHIVNNGVLNLKNVLKIMSKALISEIKYNSLNDLKRYTTQDNVIPSSIR